MAQVCLKLEKFDDADKYLRMGLVQVDNSANNNNNSSTTSTVLIFEKIGQEIDEGRKISVLCKHKWVSKNSPHRIHFKFESKNKKMVANTLGYFLLFFTV